MGADLVLILGAGASVPYGFPTGSELKNWICDMWVYRDRATATYDLNVDPNPDRPTRIYHALKSINVNPDDVASVGKQLSESKLPSIDRLVFHRGEAIAQTARMLISALLLDCESADALRNPRADGDWFSLLWANLTAGKKRLDDIDLQRLTIFTFNYERSVEQLFLSACMATYGASEDAAAEFVARIRIEHLYGITTRLRTMHKQGIDFDCDRSQLHDAIERAQKEIWLIDDDRKQQEAAFANLRVAIEVAQLVTFLGYGFDEVNDQKLGIRDVVLEVSRFNRERAEQLERVPKRQVWLQDNTMASRPIPEELAKIPRLKQEPKFQATTLGMSTREVAAAQARMAVYAGPNRGQIELLSKNCLDALREWGTFDVLRS
jgi:hypothetical protein